MADPYLGSEKLPEICLKKGIGIEDIPDLIELSPKYKELYNKCNSCFVGPFHDFFRHFYPVYKILKEDYITQPEEIKMKNALTALTEKKDMIYFPVSAHLISIGASLSNEYVKKKMPQNLKNIFTYAEFLEECEIKDLFKEVIDELKRFDRCLKYKIRDMKMAENKKVEIQFKDVRKLYSEMLLGLGVPVYRPIGQKTLLEL